MGEFDLIDLIRRSALARRDVLLGIGDDGALTRVPEGQALVTAIDTLVEDVHFPRGTDARALGWKALAVNLSDLAAMGAVPAWATLALTLPSPDARFVARFADGFAALAREHGVALVGGDTTRGPLTITVQVAGFVPARRALRRDAARVGDAVYVSGTPGDAAAGLAVVQGRLDASAAQRKALVARLERPVPRVALGVALRGVARAAIDVSDGLAADLGHVLEASGVGAELELETLPTSDALIAAVPETPVRHALQVSGGDDYELCFTAPPSRRRALGVLARRTGVPITRIGTIVARRGLVLRDADGRRVRDLAGGWDHFAR